MVWTSTWEGIWCAAFSLKFTHCSNATDLFLSNKLARVSKHEIKTAFLQVLAFSISFCVNLYLVCCFLFSADLRELKNYPIFLVNVIDLVVTGPGFMSLVFSDQFIRLHSSQISYDESYLVIWAQRSRDLVRPYARSLIVENFSWFWYICLPELITQRLNEYSNCLCALTIAYERYVMICKPYDKDVILSDTKRRRTYAALTSIICGMIIVDGVIRYLSYDFECGFGFLLSKNYKYESTNRSLTSAAYAFLFSGNCFLPVVQLIMTLHIII